MRQSILVALFALLALPGTARAALGELAPLQLAGPSECARPTGAPGELVVTTDRQTRFVRATGDGLVAGESLALGPIDCGSAVTTASGAGVAAAAGEDERGLGVAVRDPGGVWGAPQRFPALPEHQADGVAVAVSERGDAIVAWAERGFSDSENMTRYRIRAVRRAPGGTFGAPVTLDRIAAGDSPRINVGVGGNGEAVVLWTDQDRPARMRVHTTIVDTSGRFSTPLRLADLPLDATPSLAMAPDGHALVALGDGETLSVTERAPGGTFGASVRLATLRDELGAETAVALGAGGEALVAASRFSRGGVQVHTRSAAGAFRPGETLAAGDRRAPGEALGQLAITQPPRPGQWGFGGALLRASLTADGRALLAWRGPRTDVEVWELAAHLATVPLDGGASTTAMAAGGVAEVETASPLVLADGTPGVAWVEELATLRSRLRVAGDGVATAPGAGPPRLRVGRPSSPRLEASETLVLPFECSAPCDVRAQAIGRSGATALQRLPKGGKAKLRLEPYINPIAPGRLGPVRVRLTYSAPDGRVTASRTITVRLVRGPLPRAPKPVAVRAVREGRLVRVTWSLDRPARTNTFVRVFGASSRGAFDVPLTGDVLEDSAGKRSFEAGLPAGGVRWVLVEVFTPFATGNTLRFVRVR